MARSPTQNGNVFFIILLAIFMMGALSYAVFQGSRTSAVTLSADQAKLASSEILAFADVVGKSVQTLRLRGCADTQISFEPIPYHVNPLAPSDKSCNVFDTNGGKVTYVHSDPSWIVNGSTTEWWFNGETAVEGLGTSNPELIFWISNLKPEICQALNQKVLGKDPVIENIGTQTTGFNGTYNLVADGIGDDSPTDIYKGAAQGCSKGNFYSVLITR